ncbi:MAG TPA: ATP-dependent helicase HrpB [Kiritimatiellia bacterium]|nr:ATP-dependent helicase HrpB [Kiritimatiellia bacterium]
MSSPLPIHEIEASLVAALPRNRRLVIQAPTGSGKSTQVPQMLLDHGLLGDRGEVTILQPRRIAARLLAARVAQERSVKLGAEVGYQIRFEDVTSSATRIRYVTEGILLRQMMSDPDLSGISCILFDEFHERHLYGDITLARARELQRTRRPDLTLVVMSATLDLGLVEDYLKPCDVIESRGRMFPVEIRHRPTPPARDPRDDVPVWNQAAAAFAEAVRGGAAGDALVFMPGAYEISRTISALQDTPEAAGCHILPLHGDLPPHQQDEAVARYERRKIIVATNVAETSLTIDGVRIVIDAGLARIPRFDPHRGINTLLIEKISRASADQRAGRAGRTGPGLCVRLWSELEHRGRPAQELPEVRRLDLAEVALALKDAGYEDVAQFPWLEKPDPKSLERAETLLRDLGAADERTGAITELGQRMLAFPVHPRYARMLLAAGLYGGVRQVALIAALTQGRDILVRRTDRDSSERRGDLFGEHATSDFFVLMRAWSYAEKNNFALEACRRVGVHAQAARQVRPLFQYFLRLAEAQGFKTDGPPADDEAVQKCVLTGFADHLARRLDGGTLRCQLVHNRRGTLARNSVVSKCPLFVAAEVNEIEGREVDVQLSLATEVKPEWLREIFPDGFREETVAVWDDASRRVYAERRLVFRDLVLESKRNDQPPADAAAELLAERVLSGELTLTRWDEAVEQWLTRVNCLAAWCPELGIPIVTAEDRKLMIAQCCHGAVSYKDIKERDVWPFVHDWLNPAQRAMLEKHAPQRIELPSGRSARIVYSGETPPWFAATIQNLYGMTKSPRIAMGRVPLTVHLLAPSQRPVQITQDLTGFWRDHYPRVKQELSRKYPRHEWR